MAALTHFRGQVVDPKSGRPTKLFFDFVTNVSAAVEDASHTYPATVSEGANALELLQDYQFVPVNEASATQSYFGLVDVVEPSPASETFVPIQLPDGSYLQSISTSLTSSGNQTLICTAAVTVTLNTTPADGEIVKIKATNGDVIIDAGSKTIDGNSTYTIVVNYECIQCLYSAADDAWFII